MPGFAVPAVCGRIEHRIKTCTRCVYSISSICKWAKVIRFLPAHLNCNWPARFPTCCAQPREEWTSGSATNQLTPPSPVPPLMTWLGSTATWARTGFATNRSSSSSATHLLHPERRNSVSFIHVCRNHCFSVPCHRHSKYYQTDSGSLLAIISLY